MSTGYELFRLKEAIAAIDTMKILPSTLTDGQACDLRTLVKQYFPKMRLAMASRAGAVFHMSPLLFAGYVCVVECGPDWYQHEITIDGYRFCAAPIVCDPAENGISLHHQGHVRDVVLGIP